MTTRKNNRPQKPQRLVWLCPIILLLSCLPCRAASPVKAQDMSPAAWETHPIQSGRTPASHIVSVMAILATFHEAGVLPPESSPEANQLIHALIQSQSVFLTSPHPAVQEFFSSALSEKFDAKKVAVLTKAFPSTGWTSETLEALVDYSVQRSMAVEPPLAEVFHGYNVTTTDWKLVEQIFTKTKDQLLKQGRQVHSVFAAQRASMPGVRQNP